MIVSCPNCQAKYRVNDQLVPSGGAKMKCPKCSKFFAARHGGDQHHQQAPEPGQPDVSREWDVMMTGDHPDPGSVPMHPNPTGITPASVVTTPRDPFYEANPVVVERPPARPQPGQQMAGKPTAMPAAMPAATPAAMPAAPMAQSPLGSATPPAAEMSDPFANIDLTAPATAPLAGSAEGPADPAPPPPKARPIAPTAQPTVPAAQPMLPEAPLPSEPPPKTNGIAICDRLGIVKEFKYLPPAREWAAEHPDPEGLAVSIAGAAYKQLTRSTAFADVHFKRPQATPPQPAQAEPAAPSAETSSPATTSLGPTASIPAPPENNQQVQVAVTFPPPPKKEIIEQTTEPSPLIKVGLAAAVFLLAVAGLFAVWQFDLLPLEPFVTRTISQVAGVESPRIVNPHHSATDVERYLQQARKNKNSGALVAAAIDYQRVLLVNQDHKEAKAELVECYRQLGATSLAADLLKN